MDFSRILSAPLHAGQSVVRDMLDQPDQGDAKKQVLDLLAEQMGADVRKFTPQPEQEPEFSLPGLDDTLSEEALARKAEAEAAGEPFEPSEDDYKDAGPYGYLHKKAIHDAFMEYEKELQKNRPNVDYEGVLKTRLADIANAPEEHRANPLWMFAMAMGNPEHAAELVKQHKKDVEDANLQQSQRWGQLLDMKKEALEGAVKQAMQEGDAKKIVAGKWLETLAQIEQDKAKLGGTIKGIEERNAGAERRAELRGQWALAAVKARSDAMLQAAGIRTGSAEHRSMMNNAVSMLNTLVKKGETYESAHDKVLDWMDEQLPDGPGAAAAKVAPVPGAAAGAPASSNPMEAEILRGRSGAKPQ